MKIFANFESTEIAVYLGGGMRDPTVTTDHSHYVIGSRSIRVGSDDLERP